MLRLDNLRKVGLLLFQNKGKSVGIDLCVDIDTTDEALDEFLLTPQLEAGRDGAVDRDEDGLIGVVGLMVLGNEHENLVDVNFDLFNELELALEDKVVVDVFFVVAFAVTEVLIDVDVSALVALEVADVVDLVVGLSPNTGRRKTSTINVHTISSDSCTIAFIYTLDPPPQLYSTSPFLLQMNTVYPHPIPSVCSLNNPASSYLCNKENSLSYRVTLVLCRCF